MPSGFFLGKGPSNYGRCTSRCAEAVIKVSLFCAHTALDLRNLCSATRRWVPSPPTPRSIILHNQRSKSFGTPKFNLCKMFC